MNLRRIAGVAVAAAVVSGAGLLLSSPTGAVTPPTPITLNLTGMASESCPLPLNGSLAVVPNTTVLLKNDEALAALSTESVTIKPAPNSTDPTSSKTIADIPTAGSPILFTRATTYALSWRIRSLAGTLSNTEKGNLVISANAEGCRIVAQLPVPSISASAVPSPIPSAVNGAVSSAVGAVNSALPTIPPVPSGLPTVPPISGLPLPGGNPPGATPSPGANAPGTIYKPHGPTVADRTVPDGYGSGSGVGGVYVPVTGKSINAGGQQSVTGNGNQAGTAGSSAAAPVKPGGSSKTVELASNRPRSALGALPTLAVILAILALSGATAFYARTFLLQPAEARVKVKS
jgi:hypothetical protein